MNVELRDIVGVTLERNVQLDENAAYGLQRGDVVSFSNVRAGAFVVQGKHFTFVENGLQPSLTLFVVERKA